MRGHSKIKYFCGFLILKLNKNLSVFEYVTLR